MRVAIYARVSTDERHSELAFAISDAFKHARQQLHEQVRRARGR
jgi:DNA invertase Pin-like site-specific DNA recombinase